MVCVFVYNLIGKKVVMITDVQQKKKREQLLASYKLSISFFKSIPTFQLNSYCLNKMQHLSGNLSEKFTDKTREKRERGRE